MNKLFAVKVAGHRHNAPDIYWKQPGEKKRAVFDSRADANELAEREGGYVVEVARRVARKVGAS